MNVKTLQRFISTGCSALDKLLGGGLSTRCVSLVYGEAETGKTSLAIQCAVSCARAGCRTIFVDSDAGFSTRRLSQIAYYDVEKVAPMILWVRPTTFEEQTLVVDHLEEYVTDEVGLVVVDTVTSLYRVEVGAPEKTFKVNRELNRQVASLAQTAKTLKVAVLMLSQVRSIFDEGQVGVEPVATRVLKFWSDVVIKLKDTGQPHTIEAILEKYPEHKRSASCYLSIEKTGIREYGH